MARAPTHDRSEAAHEREPGPAWDAGDPHGLRVYRQLLTWLGFGVILVGLGRFMENGASPLPLFALALLLWTFAAGTQPVVARLRRRRQRRRARRNAPATGQRRGSGR